MNRSFFKYVFKTDNNGENLRMGDIIRLTKNELGGTVNAAKFALLGDPALQISIPKYRVNTLEINDQPADILTDTINPLSLVSVWGEIQSINGQKISDYNGVLSPTVFDKPTIANTLGNNGQTPFSYTVQNSILFKGNVSVKNGEFSYSFKVPKEINYKTGNGLIRYYSKNVSTDASGSFTALKLGGRPSILTSDLTGPTLRLFLNDENFVSGDPVSKAPLLLAFLEDDSGINTSGSGVGHDITVTIDENTDKMMILNDYFQTTQDSYKSGKVIFQLPDLSEGEHSLKFRVWDQANNSTQAEITFTVSSSLTIKNLKCYPNPVGEFTDILSQNTTDMEKRCLLISKSLRNRECSLMNWKQNPARQVFLINQSVGIQL
jgi:hypothetical protein